MSTTDLFSQAEGVIVAKKKDQPADPSPTKPGQPVIVDGPRYVISAQYPNKPGEYKDVFETEKETVAMEVAKITVLDERRPVIVYDRWQMVIIQKMGNEEAKK